MEEYCAAIEIQAGVAGTIYRFLQHFQEPPIMDSQNAASRSGSLQFLGMRRNSLNFVVQKIFNKNSCTKNTLYFFVQRNSRGISCTQMSRMRSFLSTLEKPMVSDDSLNFVVLRNHRFLALKNL